MKRWTDQYGQVWQCDAYDHGPLCRRCYRVGPPADPTPVCPGGVVTVDEVARTFHEKYEEFAAKCGWETQGASRVPWEDLPEENRLTMELATTAVLLRFFPHHLTPGAIT